MKRVIVAAGVVAVVVALAIPTLLRRREAGLAYTEGVRLLEANQPLLAEGSFRRALALRSDEASAHIGLGRSLGRQNKNTDALEQFREAIRLEVGNPEAHLGFALAADATKDAKQALASGREAARLNPSYVEAHRFLALLLEKLGQPDDAIREAQEALKLGQNDPASQRVLGSVYVTEAVRLAERVYRTNKESLGLSDEALGEKLTENPAFKRSTEFTAQAIGLLQKAAQAEPDNAFGQRTLGQALEIHPTGLRDLALAREAYEHSLRVEPTNALTHLRLGKLLVLLSHGSPPDPTMLEEGLSHLRRATDLDPKNVTGAWGELYLELRGRDESEAKVLLERGGDAIFPPLH